MRILYFSTDTNFVYKDFQEGALSVWIYLATLALSLTSHFTDRDNKLDVRMTKKNVCIHRFVSLVLFIWLKIDAKSEVLYELKMNVYGIRLTSHSLCHTQTFTPYLDFLVVVWDVIFPLTDYLTSPINYGMVVYLVTKNGAGSQGYFQTSETPSITLSMITKKRLKKEQSFQFLLWA